MENNKIFKFKYLIYLSIPIFIELFLQFIVGLSDQLMMSKYPTAVTGIANSTSIINMVINFFTIFSAAGIILITQYKGSNNLESINKTYDTMFYFNLFFSVFISLILLIFNKYFLNLLNCPQESMKEARIYMSICGGGIIFQMMNITFSSFFKANSMMKDSMIINIIINGLNIIGNLILIPRFQIYGVAISSISSRFIGLIFFVSRYIIKIKYKFKFRNFISNGSMLKKYFSIGIPSCSESFSYSLSQIIIQVIVNSFGIMICNVKAYGAMFQTLTYMMCQALSLGMQVIIGQLLGLGEKEEAKKKIKQTMILGIISCLVMGCTFFIFSNGLFKMFNIHDSNLLRIGKMILFIDIFLELGRAINIVCVKSMQTAGDIMFPTILSVIFCWSVAVFGSFILGSHKFLGLGLVGVWICMALDEIIRSIIFMIRFKKGKWIELKLIN